MAVILNEVERHHMIRVGIDVSIAISRHKTEYKIVKFKLSIVFNYFIPLVMLKIYFSITL